MKIFIGEQWLTKEESDNVMEVMLSGRLTIGKWNKIFSDKLCEYMGMKYCLTTNSGSSANLLAITALELPKGSEVICSAVSFPSTIAPIIQNGLIPVFVDVDEFMNIDVKSIGNAKAIVVSHTLGFPCDMKRLNSLGVPVIEDSCDALGCQPNARGLATTLSFYPAHHITTGEGGAVLTNDYELYKKIRSYRDWGRDCSCEPGEDNKCGHRFDHKIGGVTQDHKYIYSRLGYNLKMTDMQAAVGVAQMKKLPEIIRRRMYNWNWLREHLSKYPIEMPHINSLSSPFGFAMFSKDRDRITAHLEKAGILTRPVFAGDITKHPMMNGVEYKKVGTLPNTDRVFREAFWIGCHQRIGEQELNYIEQVFEDYKW